MEKADLDQILSSLKGGTFAGIDALTDVTLTGGKKNPQQGRVTKLHAGASVMIFARGGEGGAYENFVNRRLDKEGKESNFQVGPRAWGTRLEGTPYVEHKGEFYLEVIFLKPGESTYLLDGRPVSKDEIQGLPPSKPGGEQGGLEDKVQIRTYKVSSIQAIRAFGEEATV